jgi:hypothetical protein
VPPHTDSHAAKEFNIIVSSLGREKDADSSPKEEEGELIHLDAQASVQDIEAMASAWTKTSLIVAYV